MVGAESSGDGADDNAAHDDDLYDHPVPSLSFSTSSSSAANAGPTYDPVAPVKTMSSSTANAGHAYDLVTPPTVTSSSATTGAHSYDLVAPLPLTTKSSTTTAAAHSYDLVTPANGGAVPASLSSSSSVAAKDSTYDAVARGGLDATGGDDSDTSDSDAQDEARDSFRPDSMRSSATPQPHPSLNSSRQSTHDLLMSQQRTPSTSTLEGYEKADAERRRGNVASAAMILDAMMRQQMSDEGEGSPTCLTTMHRLASVYNAMGKYAEAQELYERVVRLGEHLLGLNHANVLPSKNNLASVLASRGLAHEARALYAEIIPAFEKLNGPDHEVCMTARVNMASVTEQDGDRAAATELLRSAARTRRRVLGPTSSITMQTELALAQLLLRDGQPDHRNEAHALFNAIIRLHTAQKIPLSGEVLSARQGLASVYTELGDYERAVAMLNEVLRDRVAFRKGDAESVGVASVRYALGKNLEALERFEEALDAYQSCYETRARSLGVSHEHTVKALSGVRRVGVLVQAQRDRGDY